MSRTSGVRQLGRAILLGASVGVPLLGCAPTAGTGTQQAATGAGNTEYNAALVGQDPILVTRFITANNGNPQSAALLNQMPPEVLAAVPCPAVRKLTPEVQSDLSVRVRAQCGLKQPSVSGPRPVFSSS